MKKLLLILLCLTMIFACHEESQTIQTNKEKKEIRFVISDEFILLDDETYIDAFMESASLLNLSEKERVDLINRNRDMMEAYSKREAEDISENMVIKKAESMPRRDELNQLVEMIQNQDGYLDEISPVDITLIRSGDNKYKNKYSYFEIVSRVDEKQDIMLSRYNATYYIEINTNFYQIFLNTYNQLEIDDVIIDIIEE